MFVDVEHPIAGKVSLVGPHIKMSEANPVITKAPPTLGQHTEEILKEILGISGNEVQVLRDVKAI